MKRVLDRGDHDYVNSSENRGNVIGCLIANVWIVGEASSIADEAKLTFGV